VLILGQGNANSAFVEYHLANSWMHGHLASITILGIVVICPIAELEAMVAEQASAINVVELPARLLDECTIAPVRVSRPATQTAFCPFHMKVVWVDSAPDPQLIEITGASLGFVQNQVDPGRPRPDQPCWYRLRGDLRRGTHCLRWRCLRIRVGFQSQAILRMPTVLGACP